MPEELARADEHSNMSLYGTPKNPEYILYSMGVGYKINEDPIYMVKMPIENGEPRRDDWVVVNGENHDEEFPEEPLPHRDIPDIMVDWYEELDEF